MAFGARALSIIAVLVVGCAGGGGEEATTDASTSDSAADIGLDVHDSARADTNVGMDGSSVDSHVTTDATPDTFTPPTDSAVADTFDAALPTFDLKDCTLFDNPSDLADWPVTTSITDVEFQYGGADGVHVEFSKRDGAGSWPDITPPGWTGPLEYTLGFVEIIDGKCYASAAIQFWRGLDASGGNVAQDTVTKSQCTAFGHGSTCQVAKNWYYDGRWGNLAGYQPATGEAIGVFVAAGNTRGVTDGSQSPVHERSNVVWVRMPDVSGAKDSF